MAITAASQASPWSHYRASPGGSGFSALTHISTDNVAELKEAWRIQTGDSARFGELMRQTSTQVTPILLPPEAGASLLFIGATMDRRLRAFDSKTGEVLWRATLPVDATASPMTYEIAGKQYVIIAAGGHHMFQRGSGDYLIAYALDSELITQ